MTVITEKEVRKSVAELEKIIKQAKRKLFEFETLANARTIQEGNFLVYESAKDLFKSLKRTK